MTTWAIADGFGDDVAVGLASKDEAVRVAREWVRRMGDDLAASAVRIYEECEIGYHEDYTREDLLGA